jgi:hypothetical protein
MINQNELKTLQEALATLADGFADLPEFEADFDWAAIAAVVQQAAARMQDNYTR